MKAANTHKVKKKKKSQTKFFFSSSLGATKIDQRKEKKFPISFSQSRLQNKNQLYQAIYLYQAT